MTLLRSKNSLALSWFHELEYLFEAIFFHEKIHCFSFDWRHQSHEPNAVSYDLKAIFERATRGKCNVDVVTFSKMAAPLLSRNEKLKFDLFLENEYCKRQNTTNS